MPATASDEQARFIEGVFSVTGGAIRVVSLYLPNGNPVGSDKFAYKLGWMERLEAYARRRLAAEEMFVLAGDYNVIPEPEDARNPTFWTNDALYQPESRAVFRRLVNLGLTDAFRACHARARPLHVLGLSGGRLAEEQRHPHRPPAALAAGRRPAGRARRSTSARGPSTSRPTMCPSSSSSTSDVISDVAPGRSAAVVTGSPSLALSALAGDDRQ